MSIKTQGRLTEVEKHNPQVLKDFVKVFVVPVLINKGFMLYFGLNYAEYPGEGYGYGLIASILFFVFSVASFLWKYRGIEDP